MKKILPVLLLCVSALPLYSLGAGIGMGYHHGGLYWEIPAAGALLEYIGDSTNQSLAFGLLLDTNVSRENIFNYRLALSFDFWMPDFYTLDSPAFYPTPEQVIVYPASVNTSFKVTADHFFGLALYRTPELRLWFAEVIRTAFVYREWKTDAGNTAFLRGGEAGLGFCLGLNWKWTNSLWLSAFLGGNILDIYLAGIPQKYAMGMGIGFSVFGNISFIWLLDE